MGDNPIIVQGEILLDSIVYKQHCKVMKTSCFKAWRDNFTDKKPEIFKNNNNNPLVIVINKIIPKQIHLLEQLKN